MRSQIHRDAAPQTVKRSSSDDFTFVDSVDLSRFSSRAHEWRGEASLSIGRYPCDGSPVRRPPPTVDGSTLWLSLPLLLTYVSAGAVILSVPKDAPNIHTAVALARDGDIIELADGVYVDSGNRNVEFGGKLLTIRSANGPANCVIDRQFLGRAFRAIATEPLRATLEGLTITHGFASGTNQRGGAIEFAAGRISTGSAAAWLPSCLA